MELRQKTARLAIAGLVVTSLFALSSNPEKAEGWTSTVGSVSAFLGSGQVQPKAVEVDAAGNIYSAGVINAATDFDPSPTTTFTLTPGSSNFTGYIAKMNSDGELLWAGLITGTGSSRISDLAIDSSGNMLVESEQNSIVDKSDADNIDHSASDKDST
jgi:hypothetical protein